VFHKGCVPQESNDQNIDQKDDEEHHEGLDTLAC
jgi:hypothetical protein